MSCTSRSETRAFAVRFHEAISKSKSQKQTKQRVEYAVKLAGQSLCNSLA